MFLQVSIHASVKDATLISSLLNSISKVSIHASVKDATPIFLAVLYIDVVSIHASVKDATHRRTFGPVGA